MKAEQIIFDFDGVILDSHKIKTKTFYDLFTEYGFNIAKQVKLYHLQNSGISRKIKFKYIFKNILKKKLTQNKIIFLSKKFSSYSRKEILKLRVSGNLLIFLKKFYKRIDLYISTGTPQKEIEHILKKKNLLKYFKEVHGSPRKKIQHIKKIKRNKKKTIFVGDSFEDYISCKKTNTKFILKIHSENKKIFSNYKGIKIVDFKNFKKFIL